MEVGKKREGQRKSTVSKAWLSFRSPTRCLPSRGRASSANLSQAFLLLPPCPAAAQFLLPPLVQEPARRLKPFHLPLGSSPGATPTAHTFYEGSRASKATPGSCAPFKSSSRPWDSIRSSGNELSCYSVAGAASRRARGGNLPCASPGASERGCPLIGPVGGSSSGGAAQIPSCVNQQQQKKRD